MGGFLDKPKTDKFQEHGQGNGLRYGISSMQGWRVDMEDTHNAITGLNSGGPDGNPLNDWSYFAVFDGHAGANVSAHCAKHLLDCVLQSEDFSDDVVKGIHNGFLRLDEEMRTLPEITNGEDKSGSTAVCAFISPKQMFIANCGDSRAVLSQEGRPVFTTMDHKPGLPTERERIQRAGGSVVAMRINGCLGVSRALGDFDYKKVRSIGQCEQLVSPEPEIFVRERDDGADEFLVLACDGVWDVMSNLEVCGYIHNRLQITDDLEEITSQVIDTCLYKGSRDNMSIVLVVFNGAPSPSVEAVQRDQRLDQSVERRVKEILERADSESSFKDLLRELQADQSLDFPPGIGVFAKLGLIKDIYKRLRSDIEDSDLVDSE